MDAEGLDVSKPEADVKNFKREHVMLFHPLDKEVDILDCNTFNDIFQTWEA